MKIKAFKLPNTKLNFYRSEKSIFITKQFLTFSQRNASWNAIFIFVLTSLDVYNICVQILTRLKKWILNFIKGVV